MHFLISRPSNDSVLEEAYLHVMIEHGGIIEIVNEDPNVKGVIFKTVVFTELILVPNITAWEWIM